MNETIDNGMALAVRETVSLPIPVEDAVAQWEQYQELTRRLLDDTDYQQTGQKRFKKKSAWRKYAKAFNLDDRVTFEQIDRAPDGWPLWARIRVQATAPNGRTTEADHECHITERCCPASWGGACEKEGWSNHHCCQNGCNPRIHWSHPGDIPATALTRAKNRAISDLIGAGEVSAEEMDGQRRAAPQNAPRASRTRAAAPAPAEAVYHPAAEPDEEVLDAAEWAAEQMGGQIIDGEGRELPPQKLCNCQKPRIRRTGKKTNGQSWVGWFCQVKQPNDNTKFICEPVFENA